MKTKSFILGLFLILSLLAILVSVVVILEVSAQGNGNTAGDCNTACTFMKQKCMEQAREGGKQCEKACPETQPRSVEKCKQECKKDADAYKETCKKQEKVCKGNCPCNPDRCNPTQGDECSKASCKDTTITTGSRSFSVSLCVFETNQGACCGKEKPRKTCDELRACRFGTCEEDQPPPPPPTDACSGSQDCGGMLCSLQSGVNQTVPTCNYNKNCVQNSYTEQEFPFALTCDEAKQLCCAGTGQEQLVPNGCFAIC